MNPVKIIFFGSSSYSVTILKKLLTLPDFSVISVVTKPDKPVGRNQKITSNPVADFAHQNHLPLLQPEAFTPDFKLKIRNLSLDLALCVAFGPPFFDQEMIDLFPFRIVNIHPSPLPKYRGATPGPWQIINGETHSAVTFFQIDVLPDHGPIITQLAFAISPTETSASFYDKAFNLASDHLSSVLISYVADPNSLTPQDHTQKSYFPKFTKESAKIDWSWEPIRLQRFVRAMLPWPVAWTQITDKNGQILTMKVMSTTVENGKSIPENILIEGKKPTKWSQVEKYYQL